MANPNEGARKRDCGERRQIAKNKETKRGIISSLHATGQNNKPSLYIKWVDYILDSVRACGNDACLVGTCPARVIKWFDCPIDKGCGTFACRLDTTN